MKVALVQVSPICYTTDNKFNKEQYNCIPNVLSVNPGDILTRNDLCRIFNRSILYHSIRKEGQDHRLDKNKSLQVIHIPPFPDELENNVRI